MRFRRWVVFTFMVHMLIIVLDKGAGFVLLKILEDAPDEKGAADILGTLPFIMMSVANLGLATSSVYFLRRKEYTKEEVGETASLVAMVWGGTVALVAILVTQFVMPAIKPEWEFQLAWVLPVCLCVPFLLMSSYFNSVQIAVDHIRNYNLVNLLGSVVFLPLFLVFYYAAGAVVTTSIALARLAAAMLLAGTTVWMLRKVVRWRPRMHWQFFRAAITFGWKANLTSVLTYLNHRIDLLMVPMLFVPAAMLSDEQAAKAILAQAGYYSLAVGFAELVWHFPEATRDLFFSKVAASTHDEARKFTPVLCRLSLWVAIAGSVVIVTLVDPVFSMLMPDSWEEKWSGDVLTALTILVPGTAGYTVAKILQNDLAARGHLNHCLVACSLVLAIMLTLDFAWIPQHGAIGAAWASSIAYLCSSVYSLLAYRSSGGTGVLQCLVPRVADWVYVREIAGGILDKLRWRRG